VIERARNLAESVSAVNASLMAHKQGLKMAVVSEDALWQLEQFFLSRGPSELNRDTFHALLKFYRARNP